MLPSVHISERQWIDPHHAFWAMRNEPGLAFLDSAMRGHSDSRWSYLAVAPLLELVIERTGARVRRRNSEIWKAVDDWRSLMRSAWVGAVPEMPRGAPPFAGGWIGWWGYELASQFDRIPVHETQTVASPLATFAFYDAVDCYDHGERRRWRTEITKDAPHTLDDLARDVAPVAKGAVSDRLVTGLTRDEYLRAAGRAIDYIRAGDIYQVNLSQQFTVESRLSAPDVFLRLLEASPAPYSAFLRGSEGVLLSSSPELFLSVRPQNRIAISRPIKGTRPRGADHDEDVRLAEELSASEKDRAENLMIVDLVRNDLGRVCEPGSVETMELFRREIHPTVLHLVSTVQGRLRPDCDALDAFAALFPGGSVIGAPKIRASEIIHELEPVARGPYTGALGYIGPGCAAKLAMAIRVIWINDEGAAFGAGSGIVADSGLESEYSEIMDKAQALMRALTLNEATTRIARKGRPWE